MKNVLLIFITINLFFSCKNSKKQKEEFIVTKTSNSKYGCVPPVTDAQWYKEDNTAPILDGYDVISYPITTDNELVQRYFNQGMALAYGFNHAEAARSFHYATKLDPNCAMAYFGFA